MFQEERIYEIVNMLKDRRVLSNQEIMQAFQISRDTARRDIVKLVNEGLAIRTHGGIALPVIQDEVKGYKKRLAINSEAKIRLGKYALKYISPGQICFFDVSTTIQALCQYLDENVLAFTHSLDNMEALSGKQGEVHLLGGKLEPKDRYLYGSKTILEIEDIRFDIAFLGAAAITADGIYVVDYEDACIKRKVAERAAFVCVVADGAKFNKASSFKVISFGKVDLLLTTQEPPLAVKESMKYAGTSVKVV
ncbi:DeoR/GlpR family DNA-binding transcription regulator [Propionispora hippei]|uniref:Transcriptional regulator, DeoR family n=1 Tax=Propionispora hippei DSM 15287 TaxID=1123003 RepID=A0A1M6H366_9FIRM|nr:DeoR/GlpR family DNA-binding transcription regulator [Propionispora hippei]SHJ16648.1 transcriptional regulator, DeoR family [Propionispora hippei DSM 15287]